MLEIPKRSAIHTHENANRESIHAFHFRFHCSTFSSIIITIICSSEGAVITMRYQLNHQDIQIVIRNKLRKSPGDFVHIYIDELRSVVYGWF